jgi:FixJ family two-component response regulator
MSEPQNTLLLVDDEENILSSLARLLRRDDYRILRAGSPLAGLEILAQQEVGVIISDQRMPEMTGAEFLARAREMYPDTVRIVLSGYTDLKTITAAINDGAIYKFLTKPWDDDLLRVDVRDAFRYYRLKLDNRSLNSQLQDANRELAGINMELEKHVEEKTRQLQLNIHALQISQDVLESLPLAVIGVGDDGFIALANQRAHQLLRTGNGGVIGLPVDTLVPPEVVDLCSRVQCGEDSANAGVNLSGGRRYEAHCKRIGKGDWAKGSVIVFSPVCRHADG